MRQIKYMKPEKLIKVEDFEIIVKRKKIKNINLRVDTNTGNIVLSSPYRIKEAYLKEFVLTNKIWIQEKISKISKTLKNYEIGEKHMVFGEEYSLEIIEANKNLVYIFEDKLIVETKYINDKSKIEKIVEDYYGDILKYKLDKLLPIWEKILGKKANEIRIKKMKTKWGTCNITEKRIWMNLNLAKKPNSQIEYVLAHELTHLHERYHNAKFKQIMTSVMPDWKERKKDLNKIL